MGKALIHIASPKRGLYQGFVLFRRDRRRNRVVIGRHRGAGFLLLGLSELRAAVRTAQESGG